MAADEPSSDPLEYARPATVRARAQWRRSVAWAVGGLLLILLAAEILLPRLNRPHEPSSRVKCASNLRQIGQAIQLYVNDHPGKLPDDFASLLAAEDLSPGAFVCPSSLDEIADAPTTQAVMAAMSKPGFVSYAYLGKGLTSADLNPDVVLAYEPLSNHKGTGMNVLFGDGSVEWMQGAGAQKILSQAASAQRPVKLPPNQR